MTQSTPTNALLTELGSRLFRSLRDLTACFPESAARPMGLAKAVGCKKDVSSRLFRALGKDDPLAVLYYLPGPSALRALVRLAKKQPSVSAELARDVTESIDAFDKVVSEFAGDRGILDGMIAQWLPEARDKLEFNAKQTMHRGIRSLTGVSAQAVLLTQIAVPCECGRHASICSMHGYVGLQRLRDDAKIRNSTRQLTEAEDNGGELIGDRLEHIDLTEFHSSKSSVVIDRDRAAEFGLSSILPGHTGTGSRRRADVFTATFHRCAVAHDPEAPSGSALLRRLFGVMDSPTEKLVFDALVHPSLFDPPGPTALVTETASIGALKAHSPLTEFFRLPNSDTVMSMGRGLDALRVSEYRRYVELLRRLCDRIGCNPVELEAFRLSVDYPIYSAQYHLKFGASAS